MKFRCIFGVALLGFQAVGQTETMPNREVLFSIPAMPSDGAELVSKETRTEQAVEVSVEELFLEGPEFNGHPTRIHAYFAYPADGKKYPALLELHGSGLGVLEPTLAIAHATRGYACMVIDWAGSHWTGDPENARTPPISEYTVPHHYGGRAFQPEQSPDGKWKAVPPEQSSITNGVRFARRALQFLRERPEVDAENLCLAGSSAGAHLALLVLSVEPSLRAAVVRYGSSFVRELNWGGYYAQLRAAGMNGTEPWLAVLDGKQGLADIRTPTLMLSGTDDRFFFMPAVLATWREMTNASTRLLMFPNDNHSKVGDSEITTHWLEHVLKGTPVWPDPTQMQVEPAGDQLLLSVSSDPNTGSVNFWWKQFLESDFPFRHGHDHKTDDPWERLPAHFADGKWTAELPKPPEGIQVIAYAIAESSDGTQASSDTAEFPPFPRWRDTETPSN